MTRENKRAKESRRNSRGPSETRTQAPKKTKQPAGEKKARREAIKSRKGVRYSYADRLGRPYKGNTATQIQASAVKASNQMRENKQAEAAVQFKETSSKLVKQQIFATVNPHILLQYIYSSVMRVLSTNDAPETQFIAYNYALNVWMNFEHIANGPMTNVPLPRRLARLRKLLEPKEFRGVHYSTDWRVHAGAVLAYQGGDYDINGYPFFYDIPPNQNTTPTTGFYKTNVAFVSIRPDLDYNTFLSNFSSEFDPVLYDSIQVSPSDCSAYTFDVGGPKIGGDLAGQPGRVCSFAGYNSQLPAFIEQTGEWGLEVPAPDAHVASLRLSTFCQSAVPAAFITGYVAVLGTSRRAIHSRVVLGSPAVLGYNSGRKYIKGPILLKPISLNQVAAHVMERLESISQAANATTTPGFSQADWLGAFSWGGLQMIVASWVRNQFKYYSGAYAGNVLIAGPTFVPHTPEYHIGQAAGEMCDIPEYINRSLKCLDPYMDKGVTLIPFAMPLNTLGIPSIFPTPASTYTGIPAVVVPPLAVGSRDTDTASFTTMLVLVAKYRIWERYLASYENVDPQSRPWESLLDMTVLLGSATQHAFGFKARRPITRDLLDYAKENIRFITYDFCDDTGSTTTTISSYNLSQDSTAQIYGQKFRYDLSGFDTADDIQTANRFTGMVQIGYTSNNTDATGTGGDRVGPLPPPGTFATKVLAPGRRELEPPNESAGLITRFASRLLPRAGNYCGPGWTAGVDTFRRETLIGPDGKYEVEPTGPEDAICKAHDEAYRQAKGDKDKIREADWVMVSRLGELDETSGLSIYGKAAREAIRMKAMFSKII